MISLDPALDAQVRFMVELLLHSLGKPIHLSCLERNPQCFQAVLMDLLRIGCIPFGLGDEMFSRKSNQGDMIYQ